MNMEPASPIKPASLHLLRVAERLFAERGLEGVSSREIARAAGQKNHSAVAYHFGSMNALVQEILDYRLLPLNARRQALLHYLEQAGQTANVRALVGALVVPLAQELQADPDENYSIGLISQLYARREGEQLMRENPRRMSAARHISQLLVATLQDLPQTIRIARLQQLGVQVYAVIADWDRCRRNGEEGYTSPALGWRTENFIDGLSAGLTAPVSGPCRKQWDDAR